MSIELFLIVLSGILNAISGILIALSFWGAKRYTTKE